MYTKDEVLTELREQVNDIWTGRPTANRQIFPYANAYSAILCSMELVKSNHGLEKYTFGMDLPDSLPNELDESNLNQLKSVINVSHIGIQHKLTQSILTELLEHLSLIHI